MSENAGAYIVVIFSVHQVIDMKASDMAQSSLLTLSAQSLVRAASSALEFARLFWLPWLLGTLATVLVHLILHDRIPALWPIPYWIDDLILAPCGAVITVLAFRFFATGERQSYRSINLFSTDLVVITLILFFWYTVHSYSFNWIRDASYVMLGTGGAVDQYGVPMLLQTPWIAKGFYFGWVCAFLLVKTLATFAFVGFVWNTSIREDTRGVWRTIIFSKSSIRLFLYLLLFEVALYQLEVIYQLADFWLLSFFPAVPGAMGWRSVVLPELWLFVVFLPMAFIASLIWSAAVAEFYLEREDTSHKSDA